MITSYGPNSEVISGLYSVPRRSSVIFHGFLPDSQCSLCLLGLGCPNWLHLFDQVKWMYTEKQWWHQGEGVHILSPRAANDIVGSVGPHAPLLPPFPLFFLSAPFLGVGILYPTMQTHLGSPQVCSWLVLLGYSAGAARDGFLGIFPKFPWLPQCPSCT